jgi:hypothetical protein
MISGPFMLPVLLPGFTQYPMLNIILQLMWLFIAFPMMVAILAVFLKCMSDCCKNDTPRRTRADRRAWRNIE